MEVNKILTMNGHLDLIVEEEGNIDEDYSSYIKHRSNSIKARVHAICLCVVHVQGLYS